MHTLIIKIITAILLSLPVMGIAQQQELKEQDAKALTYLLEEEKMAHDAYTAFYEQYGKRIFNNIAQSEQRHLEKVKTMVDTHKIEYRLDGEKGVFYDPEIKMLYEQLITAGMTSEEEALKTGKLIEETDIADLKEALASTANEDLKVMYSYLLEASERHLAAFNRHLGEGGEKTGKQGCKKDGCKKDATGKEGCKKEGCKKENCKKETTKL
ncbi:DUF2202 domain-containing protein [Robertkochia sediminum]|uniref:DUF2202 domain-containing protein n=1 Tax=Robertkochia sediminum TaxID=2785326 RepID=UPI001931B152|nr:DUF2202 domain-containing protein [Robertkochia sediminum]MBL7474093.1 DUF2202 domain-containing protein [Robertkochia sediminum]